MKKNQVLAASAMLGLLGVALGAFGAHALRAHLLQTGRLETFETAVKYQFYHALALLAIAVFMHLKRWRGLRIAALFMILGVVIFSGSLYMLCFTNVGIWGAVTPIGGVLLILGWACLVYVGITQKPGRTRL
ncbi:DUF423 domain-containing protein [Fulvivirgaceae bacterium BMA12]|uniref:DUF423 domain-containing protein n=1 Tax=Agaribacillus aureus TaxID=3051825 RepID=A0ABT8L2S9_9BACT|nr:DUF423 domain-containing protein [Fulvivirgaceae bacterium BMA12]